MTDMIPTSSTPTTSLAYSTQFGNKFTVSSEITVNAFQVYRSVTGDGTPGWFTLWNDDSGIKLMQVSPPALSGTGWLTVPMWSPITLSPGINYIACAFAGGATARAWATAPPAVNAPFTVVGVRFAGDQNTRPNQVSSWELLALGLTTGGAPSGGDGGTGGSTNVGSPTFSGDLAAWLSNDGTAQLHETDGLPYLTKADTADTRTKVTNGLNLAGGLQALSDSLAHTLQMASDYVAGRTATYFTDLKDRLIGASGGGGSAFYGAGGTQVSEGVEALLARSTNAQVGFPASPWAMTAETDFDGCLAWAEPADLYTVTFATTPPTIPNNGQCGIPVRYRLAWWTPLNGDFAQERRWVDFEKVHLVNPAGRMPGLLLQTYLGGTGHVQAWTLNV